MMLSLVFAGLLAFGQPQALTIAGSLPAPPPPPPLIHDRVLDAAVNKATRCVAAGDGGAAAEQALRNITGGPGGADWQRARASVLMVVERREAEKRCLIDLDDKLRNADVSNQDRVAGRFYLRGLIQEWLERAPHEAELLVRLIDPQTSVSASDVPPLVP